MAAVSDVAVGYLRGTVVWRRRLELAPRRTAPNRVRVAYFMNLFPNLTETFVYRELESVRAAGVEVVPISIRRPTPEQVSADARHLFDQTCYVLPLPVLRTLSEHVRALARRPGRYLRLAWETIAGTHERGRDRLRSACHFIEAISLARLIADSGVQHLHAHFAVGSATCAWILSRYLDLPFSFTAHAYDIWLDRLLLPEKLRDASLVVTCTGENRRHLLETYRGARDDIEVIHHGVDARRFAAVERPPREVPRLLSVGRLCEQKGFDVLLRACALLQHDGDRFECDIVGAGDLESELRQLADDLGLRTVRFLGRAFQEDLPGHYARADVFALACKRASDNDRDGIPNTLMEAMACGLPVVSTRFSGIPELVVDGETGLLVPPEDPLELARALRRVLRDPDLRRRLGGAGRARVVREFSLERAATELLDAFERAAAPALARAAWS